MATPRYESLMEVVRSRMTNRAFAPADIPRAHVEMILEAARHAPSGANAQPWHFVVVTDEAAKAAIGRCFVDEQQHRAKLRMGFPTPNYNGVKTAPGLIVIAADFRFVRAFPVLNDGSDLDRLYHQNAERILLQSVAAATMSAHLAAAALGYAVWWITAIGQEDIQKQVKPLLGVPDELGIIDVMCFGPAAQAVLQALEEAPRPDRELGPLRSRQSHDRRRDRRMGEDHAAQGDVPRREPGGLMTPLIPVDRVRVTTVVDNYIDALRQDEKVARRHSAFVARQMVDLRAEHGLAHLVEITRGRETTRIAFDFGPSEAAITHNFRVLGLDPAAVDVLALSHGHWDHFGGLLGFLRTYRPAMKKPLTFHGGADHFLPRWNQRGADRVSMGRLYREEIERYDVGVETVRTPTLLAEGALLSGEMHEAEAFEPIPANLQIERDGAIGPDDFLGEQTLIAHVKGRGLVVVTSCSHRGIVGICRNAARIAGVSKVHAVIGGFHLSGLKEERVTRVVDGLPGARGGLGGAAALHRARVHGHPAPPPSVRDGGDLGRLHLHLRGVGAPRPRAPHPGPSPQRGEGLLLEVAGGGEAPAAVAA